MLRGGTILIKNFYSSPYATRVLETNLFQSYNKVSLQTSEIWLCSYFTFLTPVPYLSTKLTHIYDISSETTTFTYNTYKMYIVQLYMPFCPSFSTRIDFVRNMSGFFIFRNKMTISIQLSRVSFSAPSLKWWNIYTTLGIWPLAHFWVGSAFLKIPVNLIWIAHLISSVPESQSHPVKRDWLQSIWLIVCVWEWGRAGWLPNLLEMDRSSLERVFGFHALQPLLNHLV